MINRCGRPLAKRTQATGVFACARVIGLKLWMRVPPCADGRAARHVLVRADFCQRFAVGEAVADLGREFLGVIGRAAHVVSLRVRRAVCGWCWLRSATSHRGIRDGRHRRSGRRRHRELTVGGQRRQPLWPFQRRRAARCAFSLANMACSDAALRSAFTRPGALLHQVREWRGSDAGRPAQPWASSLDLVCLDLTVQRHDGTTESCVLRCQFAQFLFQAEALALCSIEPMLCTAEPQRVTVHSPTCRRGDTGGSIRRCVRRPIGRRPVDEL